ncbi:nitrate- and nitrite sensing domain-containing protein [Azoarcus sp. L1K30]|uniref:nitrate regulatory protein n=1 Tax=Azoarcus sp. L1K30 TaxID=2820277 RepID=UPI001B839537|nr:nitrate regulatory protein [Azoarcus sp. L1K30]MBR0568645.1 nitrate- and nitrite sensing domain-containing protein [Azoarcus sp. L1K30]
MKSALGFLIAARRCEIHGLEQLEVTSELVKGVSELVHMLQRERGTSNIYLASGGKRFAGQRAERVAASLAVESAVREQFSGLDTDSGRMAGGVRLFSRIAHVLHGLDSLPALRERIAANDITSDEAMRCYTELVAGLLAVVFEAADTAANPVISRALVALFNFMQGKELAGQERAVGAAGFAAGRFDAAGQQRLAHLIDAQERCFQIFTEFADATLRTIWRNAQNSEAVAALERMRRIACAASPAAFDGDAGERWYECATARIDVMRQVEDCATNALLHVCETQLTEARADLQDHKRFLDSLSALGGQAAAPVAIFLDKPARSDDVGAAGDNEGLLSAGGLGPHLGRSVLDLMQAQSQRLQTMSDELNTARAALNERKLVERAKGLLMSRLGLNEAEAYKMLQQTAMNQHRRLADVAEATLSLADFLKRG